MSGKTYFVDLDAKRITLPNSRWYRTEAGTFPSATSVLSVKAKVGLTNWQITLASHGVDPKGASRDAMDEGSAVHDACERLMKGEELSFYDVSGAENYKLHEEWLPITRFIDAHDKLAIKPILIEQTIYNAGLGYAGTLDLLCGIQPDPKVKKRALAVIDLKRAKASSPEYLWQVASYVRAVQWMYTHLEAFRDNLLEQGITQDMIDGLKGYLLLLNVDSKAGWRLTEVENIERSYGNFEACYHLFKDACPSFEFAEEQYPLTLSLGGKK